MFDHFIQTNIDADDPAFLYLQLRHDEKILYLVRHHWVGYLGTILIVIAMAIVPAAILWLLHSAAPNIFVNNSAFVAMLSTVYYLFLATFLFTSLINYYYNIVIITNQRLINIAQEGLLSRQTSELDFADIENVSADINGLLQSWFNFGLLVVETAGGGTSGAMVKPGYFTVQDVPDPNRIARVILDLKINAGKDGGE